MSTNTSRLALVKPDPGEVQDINVLNANFDKLDLNNGFRQCTSGTRPTSPWRGLVIEETDTNKLLWWNGVGWKILAEDTGWLTDSTAFTYASGFSTSQSSLAAKRRNGVVFLRGTVNPDSGDLAATTWTDVATLASGFRPPVGSPGNLAYFGVTTWVAGAGTEYISDGSLRINESTGLVQVYMPRLASGAIVHSVCFSATGTGL